MSETETPVDVDGHLDLPRVVDDLNRLLRLRTTPIGMKRFETVAEMEAVPRVRRPSAIHTMDQIVGQAARNGWTVQKPTTSPARRASEPASRATAVRVRDRSSQARQVRVRYSRLGSSSTIARASSGSCSA